MLSAQADRRCNINIVGEKVSILQTMIDQECWTFNYESGGSVVGIMHACAHESAGDWRDVMI